MSVMSYEQVEPLLNKKAWEFSLAHAIDWEECKSAANEGYVVAVRTYDETRASFTTHLYWKVRGALTRLLERARHDKRVVLCDLSHVAEAPPLRLLSEDASAIVRMVAESPAELKRALRRGGREGAKRWLAKRAKKKGMSLAQVISAFDEFTDLFN